MSGQLLLVFQASELDARLARLRYVMREVPPRFLDATASLLERIPPSTMGRLVRSNPEILSAEQEYASALAESERQTSLAARKRLKRAEGLRKQAYETAGGLRPEGLSSLHNLQAEALETLRWLEEQRARFEVRAPVEGEMELLDLKPGMVVPPLAPLALMNVAGKFVLQTRVRQNVKAGQRIEVEIPGSSRVPAVVDSCENGRLLAHLTIPYRAPATSGKVQVVF
jgi:multidrug resistance efflux pump